MPCRTKRKRFRETRSRSHARRKVHWASPDQMSCTSSFCPEERRVTPLCVYYGNLNVVIARDSYPLRGMDECSDSLGKTTVFLTLHVNSDYWWIEVEEVDGDKIAFNSHRGVYRFFSMPHGLGNAHGTFQWAMVFLLFTIKRQYALFSFDDVDIFSKKIARHIDHVRTILTLLGDPVVASRPKKCGFYISSFNNLGEVIKARRLEIASHISDAVPNLKPPTSLTELQPILELRNVFPRFVAKLVCVAAPLSNQ